MRPVSFEPVPLALDELVLPAHQYAASEYMVTGVYFLYRYGELIYIGQSDNILARIASHRSSGRDFDTFSIFRCGKEWLLPLEAAFIRKFQPPENRAHTKADIHPFGDRVAANDTHLPEVVVRPVNERLRTPQAAKYIGVSESTLEKYRHFGGGPRYSKLGRSVIYETADINAWLDERKRAETWGNGGEG